MAALKLLPVHFRVLASQSQTRARACGVTIGADDCTRITESGRTGRKITGQVNNQDQD